LSALPEKRKRSVITYESESTPSVRVAKRSEGEHAAQGPFAVVWDNLNLLRLEVTTLVREVEQLLESTASHADKALEREDYIDNLESQVDNAVFALIRARNLARSDVDLLRAAQTVAVNLERIADFAINIIGQLCYLAAPELVQSCAPAPFFSLIYKSLDALVPALQKRELRAGLEICRAEFRIDDLYREVFLQIMARLRRGESPEDLVTTLFIYRYLERMGDSLLNIGESILFAAVGEKIKISHYEALQQTLENSATELDISALEYEGIWGTRSGARIGCVHSKGANATRWVIFKEGQLTKIAEEKRGLERWAQIWPDLPPRIIGYHEHGDHASLLLEYLQGQNLQHIVLENDFAGIKKALNLLLNMVARIWESTLESTSARANFVAQIAKRLEEVLKLHPEFDTPPVKIGAVEIPSMRAVLAQAHRLDEALVAPFSVLLHGDFNLDNVMINLEEERIRVIDLHRTALGDYVQDASVFLVSAFRIPSLDPAVRARLNAVSALLLEFVGDFAQRHNDHTWAARLALGVARSMLTSTRFVVNEQLAATMCQRARFLLQSLLAHPPADFATYCFDATLVEY
jgi:phosphate uptake regulator/aminoglycoside phosphotransferase (APT) family kinase protein